MCSPDGLDSEIVRQVRGSAVEEANEQIEKLKKDPQYSHLDFAGYSKELAALQFDNSVLTIILPLLMCGQAREDGTKFGEGRNDTPEQQAAIGWTVGWAKILCPDVAGEVPTPVVDCGGVDLTNFTKSGRVKVRTGDVDCDDAVEVIRKSWAELMSTNRRGIKYEADGVEYGCSLSGAAEAGACQDVCVRT